MSLGQRRPTALPRVTFQPPTSVDIEHLARRRHLTPNGIRRSASAAGDGRIVAAVVERLNP
jgi:hypothetical protein